MDPLIDLDEPWNAGALCLQAKSGEALPRIVAELKHLQMEADLVPLADVSISARHLASPKAKFANAPKAKASVAPSVSRLSQVAAPKAKAGTLTLRASSLSSVPQRRTPSPSPALSRPSSAAKAAAAALGLGGSAADARNLVATSCVNAGPVHGFFVYGTLRPDDDSGTSWTKTFCDGLDAEPARLHGASLYVENFPAVCLERTRCSVRGVFLSVPAGPACARTLKAKLAEADRIEGYPDLYDRTVKTVRTATGLERQAYVYHRTGRTDRQSCVRVEDGDWLSRQNGGKQ